MLIPSVYIMSLFVPHNKPVTLSQIVFFAVTMSLFVPRNQHPITLAQHFLSDLTIPLFQRLEIYPSN
jgi:hypothetical protein